MTSTTSQTNVRLLKFARFAGGSLALLMMLGIASYQASADDKIKSGGKFVDDPLPEKPPAGWQEYVQEKYKAYSIWLPKTGRTLVQTEGKVDVRVSQTKTAKLGYVILACEIKNDLSLFVERLIYPLEKGEMIDARETIEAFRDLHMEKHPGTITQEFDLMLGKMQGKEYRIDLKNGQKSRLRVYQVGRAIWRIWMTGTEEQVMGDKAKLIFSSFKNQMLIKEKK